jgi:hypothetical protein
MTKHDVIVLLCDVIVSYLALASSRIGAEPPWVSCHEVRCAACGDSGRATRNDTSLPLAALFKTTAIKSSILFVHQ